MKQQAVQEQIHHFWFGNDIYGDFPVENIRFWYASSADPDWLNEQSEKLAFIEDHFLFLVKSACQGGLNDWQTEPRSLMSLILLLDQFAPRLFHNKEYEARCKQLSLQYCRKGLADNFDKCLTPVERSFFYGPLLHADKISLRMIGVQLLESLLEELSFVENPFHRQRNHIMTSLYQAIAQKTRIEKRYLGASA